MIGILSVPHKDRLDEKDLVTELVVPTSPDGAFTTTQPLYRLYKRRWIGVFALFLLEVHSVLPPGLGLAPYLTMVLTVVRDFGFTLDEINWLGNIVGLRKLVVLLPAVLLLSAWVRYAGTARSLSKHGAYTLIIIGQQPVYQILAPKYSERWFDLKGRTTATMIISIANPIGGGLGQLLSPSFSNTRTSILALAIMSTAVVPITFLVLEAPPTPPSYSGSRTSSPSIMSLFRAAIGQRSTPETYMTVRERFDFAILVSVFSALLASINGFSILSSQWLRPSPPRPLFDRVLTHHLAITVRTLCPITGITWLSLIWAVRENNTGALFTLFIIIGVCSISLLPVAIELGVELTRNSDGSSAVLWFFGNLLSITFILAQGALRADRVTGNPPLNMHRAIVFNGIVVFAVSLLVFFLRGRQTRRELDEQMNMQQLSHSPSPAAERKSTENIVSAREPCFVSPPALPLSAAYTWNISFLDYYQ
ncbi:MFS general substrate transporter [Lactarius indigo]|nr:MFS general substrate transporter [Lactarius indigo]